MSVKRFRFPTNEPPRPRRRRPSDDSNTSDLRTIWIGDLELWEDEAYLLNYLQTILPSCPLCGIKVVIDGETGLSQGFGFLDFENHQVAEEALNILRRTVRPGHTRRFKATWAASNTQKPSLLPRAVPPPDGCTIHVSNLNRRLRDTELQDWFVSLGFPNLVSVRIVRREGTLESKGYAFVKFSSPIEAQAALAALSGQVLAGYPIQLAPAGRGVGLTQWGGMAQAVVAAQPIEAPRMQLRSRAECTLISDFLPLCLQELFSI